ncbi:MAG TPA: FixH family protein [Phenylobacterium sp.]
MSATHASEGFRLKGWHVLAGVVGFFAVVVAVDMVFLVQAIRTFPGQVSVTPYEDGLAYNRKLAQVEAQALLGWSAAAEASADGVSLTVRNARGKPVHGLAISGLLQRPATETGAHTLAFREAAPGLYFARQPGLAGAWDLTAEARTPAGRSFQAERRLTWP